MQCDWIKSGDRRYECIRCGRVLVIPKGLPVPPDFSKTPPCGWRPHVIHHGDHDWYEVYDSDPKFYMCPKCGVKTRLPLEYGIPCSRKELPVRTALRYAEAVARWTAAGFPLRSMEEVSKIHAICLECPHYNSKRETCVLCGCRCNSNAVPLLNKIRMATEQCPDNPPRWLAKV